MSEKFRPVSNTPPDSIVGFAKFYGRMIFDLQIRSIYRDIKKHLPSFRGNILDVGCGQSPYRSILNQNETTYFGIDIIDADKFDYQNKDIVHFNGEDIPFENEKFDGFICTEVFEHVHNYDKLISELYRVCKPGAVGIITIPWSARYHYIPHDYFRYTPSTLKIMFSKFQEMKIANRGTDITSIVAKIIVLFFRNIFPSVAYKYIFSIFWLCLSPILLPLIIIAHLSIIFNWGSTDDPLGYTILVKK